MPCYELSKCTSYKNCASVQFVPDSLLNLMIFFDVLCCHNQGIFWKFNENNRWVWGGGTEVERDIHVL